jgi:hypothetical protein
MKLKKLVMVPALLLLVSINFSCGLKSSFTFTNSSSATVSIVFPEGDTLELLVDQVVEQECSIFISFTFTSTVPVKVIKRTSSSFEFIYDANGITSGDEDDAEYESTDSTNSSSCGTLSTAVRCRATTQDGTRCERMTKNACGYCWQHK